MQLNYLLPASNRKLKHWLISCAKTHIKFHLLMKNWQVI